MRKIYQNGHIKYINTCDRYIECVLVFPNKPLLFGIFNCHRKCFKQLRETVPRVSENIKMY